MSALAPRAIASVAARRALFLRSPRGRVSRVSRPLHFFTRNATDGPSQDKPFPPGDAREYDAGAILNRTGTHARRPSFPAIFEDARPRARAPPPSRRVLSSASTLFTYRSYVSPRAGFLVTAQSSRERKRVARAVEEARYMLTRGDDPPALGEPAPLLKAGELGCAFLPLLGHLPNMVTAYAKEAVTTFVSDPTPPHNTPEYLARLVPVERACDASVHAIAETLTQIVEFEHPELRPTLEPQTYGDAARDAVAWTMHYEHHGHTRDVPRAALEDAVAAMFPPPDFVREDERVGGGVHGEAKEGSKFCAFIAVFEGVALVTVTRDWDVTRGYRAREMAERGEARREGADHAAAETTGGGGYP